LFAGATQGTRWESWAVPAAVTGEDAAAHGAPLGSPVSLSPGGLGKASGGDRAWSRCRKPEYLFARTKPRELGTLVISQTARSPNPPPPRGTTRPSILMAAVAVLLVGWTALTPLRAAYRSRSGEGCPRRIVSLNLAADEILVDLVPRERITALTYLAPIEGLSHIADRVDGLNATATMNLERVVAMRPDLVILSRYAPAGFPEQLEGAGIRTVVLDEFDSIAGIERTILRIGDAVCEPERARMLVEGMRTALEQVASTIPRHKPPPRVLYYTPDGFTAGASTLIGEMITRAGGVNAAAALGIVGESRISLEYVLAIDPDVIVTGTLDGGPDATRRLLQRDPVLATLRAVRDGKVYGLEEKYLTSASHHVVEGVSMLARIIWQQGAERR